MSIEPLRQCLRNRWSFLWGWKHRETILHLCKLFEDSPRQESELREALIAANHARELAEKQSEAVCKGVADTKAELRQLHQKHADLLRRKEAPEERVARDALVTANLEIHDLKSRLDTERQAHEKTKANIQRMWQFIMLRHRIGEPVRDGSIRKILMDAERQ